MKPYVEKVYDKKGAVLLSTYYFPVQIAWSSKKLTSLEDLKARRSVPPRRSRSSS